MRSEPFSWELLCPGDLADKLAILHLKLTRIGHSEALQEDIRRTTALFFIVLDTNKSKERRAWDLYDELVKVNNHQWELEDRVRTEHSWQAAQAARTNNTQRVKLKNQMNELLGYPSEQKKYQGE